MAGRPETSRENGKKGGRPKGSKGGNTLAAEKAKEYIIACVEKELKPIIEKAIEQAKAGDKDARKELLDRAYGKVKETVELQGVDFMFDEDNT